MKKNVDYVVEFVKSRVVLKFHHLSVDDDDKAEVIVFHRDQSGKNAQLRLSLSDYQFHAC